MPEKKLSNQTKVTGKKKLLYNLMAGVFVPLLILILFEIVLRLFGYGENYDLFTKIPDEHYKDYLMMNPHIGSKYFHRVEYTSPANDILKKKKPENTFRIFIMGSSTVYGFPYGYNLMFSRILRERLQEVYPDINIEVINTAITAVNSYTLLDLTDQILKHEPDAVLIYAGHNEFYGAMGVGSLESSGKSPGLIRFHLKMMNFRLYQFLQNIIHGLARKASKGEKNRGTLMKRIVSKNTIIYQSEDYKAGIEQFRNNMSRIAEKFTDKDVPVFFSQVVSNIRDLPPFKSVRTEDLPSAEELYLKAKKADRTGNYETAKDLYKQARDLDCVRFRASGEINSVIDLIAKEYEITVVKMPDAFEKRSPHGIVGHNLLTEHVHPNYNGIFIMAEAFYNAMINSQLIGTEPDRYTVHNSAYHKLNWGFTILDTLIAHHRITNLSYHWPFRSSEAPFIDYRTIYKPVSFVDSIAFKVLVSKEFNVEDAHFEMADYFENRGDLFNAYKETNALVKMNPYWAPHYRKAAGYLLSLNDIPKALDYFEKSLEYEESFYAHFKAGEIYLLLNDPETAISHFEASEVLSERSTLPNVYYNLYLAYAFTGQTEKAREMTEKLKKTYPGVNLQLPARGNMLMKYIPVDIADKVTRARELMHENRNEEARDLLHQVTLINDSPVINRLLAEIYYSERNANAADFYFRKVYRWFKTDPKFLHHYFLFNLAIGKNDLASDCLREIEYIAPNYPALQSLEGLLKNQMSN